MPRQKTLKLTVKYTDLQALVEEGKNITVTPKAENAMVALLELQEKVQEAIDQAKKVIEEKALELNPNFSSVRSDKVRVYYRAHGSKFAIDESKVQFLPKDTYKMKVTYSPDSKVLDQYAKEHNGLYPDGVIIRERTKSLSISLINEKENYDIED